MRASGCRHRPSSDIRPNSARCMTITWLAELQRGSNDSDWQYSAVLPGAYTRQATKLNCAQYATKTSALFYVLVVTSDLSFFGEGGGKYLNFAMVPTGTFEVFTLNLADPPFHQRRCGNRCAEFLQGGETDTQTNRYRPRPSMASCAKNEQTN